jgi:hypothetical protein
VAVKPEERAIEEGVAAGLEIYREQLQLLRVTELVRAERSKVELVVGGDDRGPGPARES